ncbi:MurR/RpiR family transcriptional regulator [Lacticaseibacillus kribbianus]|uniref:MurR/RpiR family transcriptional regulator n=1 Tax=Lacticaseibacillus kribbianus TaxID=2926292 RepID=UPI001CD75C18|nr:MurR/RpiR family transcriptional regulator [Lacticaseibacillus kribbianus]
MSVKGRINNAMAGLSEAETKVADFVLAHPEEVINMTASQLAAAADSSPASVIRLTKRLDIEGFTALKILLATDLTKAPSDPAADSDITEGEALGSIKQKLLGSALQSIRETTDQVNEGEVDALVRAIKSTHQLYLFGIGASALAAANICQKWNRIGYPTVADADLNALLPKLVNARRGDVLWVISNSGESPEVLIAAKEARRRGVRLASLTRFGNNSLAKLSDIAVHTSQPMERENRIAATNSLLAQFMIIDVIFYYFVSRNFAASAQALDRSHQVISAYKDTLRK